MKLFVIISLVILTSFSCSAQVLKVLLQSKNEKNKVFNQNIPTFPVENKKVYKGIDSSKYEFWDIKSLILNTTQYVSEITKSKDEFRKYANKNNLDTTYIYSGKIKRNSAAILVGVDHQGFKQVVIDENNNQDCSDDQAYIFNLLNKEELRLVYVEFDIFNGLRIEAKRFPFFLDPYSPSQDAKDKSSMLQINLINRSFKEGFVKIDSKTYQIQISDQYKHAYKNYPYFINVTNVPIDTNSNNYYRFKHNEELFFDNSIYTIDGLDSNSITIRFLKKAEYNGAKVASYAPDFILRDYVSKEIFTLKKNKGSFILVDFWGSWCVPCIENIPKLVAAKNKLKNKNIQFVSIAYDDLNDTTILKKLISENEMDWTHLLIPKNAKSEATILKNYQIQVYPTILIIDKQGKVIYRGTGEIGVSKGLDFIDKTLLN
jgi:thiol-disulfide isomerase/thioredoxin